MHHGEDLGAKPPVAGQFSQFHKKNSFLTPIERNFVPF